MFDSLSLKTKLLMLCLILSAVSIAVGFSNFRTSRRVVGEYHLVTSENMPKLERLNQMFLEFRSLRIALRTLGYENLPTDVATSSLAKVNKAIEDFETMRKGYDSQPFSSGEEELFRRLMASWDRFRVLGNKILAKYEHRQDSREREQMLKMFLYDCPEHADDFLKEAGTLNRFHQKLAADRVAAAEEESKQANTTSLILIFSGTLIGLFLGYWVSNSISRSLRQVAVGLFKQAEAVNGIAAQLSSSSESLSTNTNRQTTALQETSSAVEETTAMISRNAENAKASSTVSRESERSVERGRQAVEAVVQSIREIATSNTAIMSQIEESNREISNIVRVIGEIEDKTKVINDIVFQTKLLSFNASVEAARAGEHGKGFAVVAEEVGKLAQMSGNSAKEISDMLDKSMKEVEQIVSKMQTRIAGLIEDARLKVQTGMSTAESCNGNLNEIVENVSRVGNLVSEISEASQEQSKGVSEINNAMIELEKVAQQNDMAAHDTAQSAEVLKERVDSVRTFVSDLDAVLNGRKLTSAEYEGGVSSIPFQIESTDQTSRAA